MADAGNRRVRLLTVHQAPGESFADLTAAKGSYRIVYAGNSFVDYDGDDRTSIASLIEDSLRTRATALGLPHPPRLFTVKLIADVSGLGSFIRNYFAGTADLVIWQTNAAELTGFVGASSLGGSLAPSVDTWRPVFARELRSTRDVLAAEHTPMLAVLNPMPWQISPIESAYQRLYDLPVPAYEIARADGDLLRRAFADAGVPGLDLFRHSKRANARRIATRSSLRSTITSRRTARARRARDRRETREHAPLGRERARALTEWA